MKTKLQPPETAELHNKLYKTEEEQQIFLGFRFLNNTQSKIFLDFRIANHNEKMKQTKEANEEKQ